MTRGDTPVGQLRRLRSELRRERERCEFTQKEVAEALDWSLSKIIRIERGPVGISVTDVRALLQHYEVTDKDRINDLVEMARAAKQPAWWHKYRDIYGHQFLTFLGLESSAIRIRQFQGLVVPGLLQTEDYARVMVGASHEEPERAKRGVGVRMERQRLRELDGLEMFFILDEAALRRMVGGPTVLHAQLVELVRLAALPNLTIQVVPFSVGMHKGMRSSFEIFELSEEDDDFAMVLESAVGDTLIEETTDEVRGYVAIFKELETVALAPAESVKFIERIIEEMGADQ
jgi:transcriptional regulator with XRE-family HTH domain